MHRRDRLSPVQLGSIALILALVGLPWSGQAEVRDGKLYDPGVTREAPAENAPADLARMASFVGQWDVDLEFFPRGQEPLRSQGIASVTYMNRGHSLMERMRVDDFDGQGHSMATLAFLSLDGRGVWSYGEGGSWSEAITLYSGGFEDEALVLHNSMRPGGGTLLLLQRKTFERQGDEGFEMRSELSIDLGKTWGMSARRTYRRRAPSAEFFPVRDDLGQPAPGRPAAAAEFDFLLGDYLARHWLLLPPGPVSFPANATAVHVLDGHGILEFNWHDNDPSLPDAATSILRVYNRSMRRWESLFLSNRANVPLHFGGVREDDRIVLHPFAAQTGGNPLSQWIFFDVRDDAYRWKGLRSLDRGQTWPVTWAIDFERKGVEHPDPTTAPPSEVRVTTADGVEIVGDHYRPSAPASSTVVLFHQAGGDARGEYGSIARRLVAEGFEVFAWDARSGGDRFGQPNRTVAGLGSSVEGYCPAYPDLEAALEHVFLQGGGGPIFAVGSSYSAALVVRLAAEHGRRLAGVAAFSPASGRMEDCAVDRWLAQATDTPLLVFRPEGELAHESVAAQGQLLAERGIEVFVAPEAVHGASMLVDERNPGDVAPTWERFLAFLADPAPEPSE